MLGEPPLPFTVLLPLQMSLGYIPGKGQTAEEGRGSFPYPQGYIRASGKEEDILFLKTGSLFSESLVL